MSYYANKFDDDRAYYLSSQKIKVGDIIFNGPNSEIKIGNALPLKDIPVGMDIHNVELQPGAGGKIARAAGAHVTISGSDGNYSIIKMSIWRSKKIDSRCLATIGVLSNQIKKMLVLEKLVDLDG